uniref:DinB-like domain-containing protein n=1 Tax=Solibacter usitatus (strain Ellin6076) TaxID=234267 RepID=Q01ZW7_SOLUE
MKKTLALLLGTTLSLCAADVTVATLYDSQLKMAEGEFVSLAKAMPESAYSFAPTQGAFEKVRTFGEQVKHVATVMYMVAAAAKQEAPPVDLGTGEAGPPALKSKAEIVKYLQDSFAYAHTSMAMLTAANQLDLVKAPFPGMPDTARAGIANLAIWHAFDHYGQMVVYARMNNVIPPASQPAPPPMGAKKKK